jgi:prepilin-type N-terminal cleavage/methylation domain-containing protein
MPKSEIRIPKAERNPKCRIPNVRRFGSVIRKKRAFRIESQEAAVAESSNFRIRASFGLRPSGFGFSTVLREGNIISAKHRPSPISTNAFTLVEMMVVVVLIGILTAMIIPEMKGTYEDALLRSTSRELLNAFSLASSRAVSLNQTHRVRLDRRAGYYYVEKRVRKSARQPEFIPIVDVAGAQGDLDSRIVIQMRQGEGSSEALAAGADVSPPNDESTVSNDATGETVGFYGDGTADPAEFLLRDRAGFRLVLRINPITSRVRVVELARAPESSP